MSSRRLRDLENESIEMLREAAAEFNNPVMLYSIGKDFLGPSPSGDKSLLSFSPAISIIAH